MFEYLSLLDLYQVFCHLNNSRLGCLVLSKRHPLVVGSLRCVQMRQLLDVNNRVHLKCFTDLIDTLVLDDSLASSVFLKHISKRMDATQPLSCPLPSMTQLIIFEGNHQSNPLLRALLLPINFCNHSLRQVHLVFDRPTGQYSSILSMLVSNRISFHTMILEVENGRYWDWLLCEELYEQNLEDEVHSAERALVDHRKYEPFAFLQISLTRCPRWL